MSVTAEEEILVGFEMGLHCILLCQLSVMSDQCVLLFLKSVALRVALVEFDFSNLCTIYNACQIGSF